MHRLPGKEWFLTGVCLILLASLQIHAEHLVMIIYTDMIHACTAKPDHLKMVVTVLNSYVRGEVSGGGGGGGGRTLLVISLLK